MFDLWTDATTSKGQNVAPHTNKDLTPLSTLTLYYAAVHTVLVEQTIQYHEQYSATLDGGPSTASDMTELVSDHHHSNVT
jgi:hypothetical protein